MNEKKLRNTAKKITMPDELKERILAQVDETVPENEVYADEQTFTVEHVPSRSITRIIAGIAACTVVVGGAIAGGAVLLSRGTLPEDQLTDVLAETTTPDDAEESEHETRVESEDEMLPYQISPKINFDDIEGCIDFSGCKNHVHYIDTPAMTFPEEMTPIIKDWFKTVLTEQVTFDNDTFDPSERITFTSGDDPRFYVEFSCDGSNMARATMWNDDADENILRLVNFFSIDENRVISELNDIIGYNEKLAFKKPSDDERYAPPFSDEETFPNLTCLHPEYGSLELVHVDSMKIFDALSCGWDWSDSETVEGFMNMPYITLINSDFTSDETDVRTIYIYEDGSVQVCFVYETDYYASYDELIADTDMRNYYMVLYRDVDGEYSDGSSKLYRMIEGILNMYYPVYDIPD